MTLLQVVAISPPAEISPLKFRGWLQRQVASIDGVQAGEGDVRVVLKVFVTPRVRQVLVPKKMQVFLRETARKNPRILSILLADTAHPLQADALAHEVEKSAAEFAAAHAQMQSFVQSMGYQAAPADGEAPSQDDLVCVVGNIVPANQATLSEQTGIDFSVGDWFASMPQGEALAVHGPYENEDEAKTFARSACGAVYFQKDDA